MTQTTRPETPGARRGWRAPGAFVGRRFAFCVCALAALAASAANATAQTPRATAQASRATAQAPRDTAAAMALYRAAAAKFAGAKTIRASFEQTLISPVSTTPRTSRGELMQRPPNRFAFRFTDPPGDAVLSDGDALWVYLPSTAKGQVLKLPRELGGAFDVVSRLLSNPGDRTQVRVVPESDRVGGETVTAFSLTPRSDGAPFLSAKVWIGVDALVRQIEIEEPGGLRRRLRFSKMRLGVSLPKGAFVFTVPTGVRIVDQAALMGGGARKP